MEQAQLGELSQSLKSDGLTQVIFDVASQLLHLRFGERLVSERLRGQHLQVM
ncbi:hypothetical protein D3C85_1935000 [compost metagenome]